MVKFCHKSQGLIIMTHVPLMFLWHTFSLKEKMTNWCQVTKSFIFSPKSHNCPFCPLSDKVRQKYWQYVQKHKYLFYYRARLENINYIIFSNYSIFCLQLDALIYVITDDRDKWALCQNLPPVPNFFLFLLSFVSLFLLPYILCVQFIFTSFQREYK